MTQFMVEYDFRLFLRVTHQRQNHNISVTVSDTRSLNHIISTQRYLTVNSELGTDIVKHFTSRLIFFGNITLTNLHPKMTAEHFVDQQHNEHTQPDTSKHGTDIKCHGCPVEQVDSTPVMECIQPFACIQHKIDERQQVRA